MTEFSWYILRFILSNLLDLSLSKYSRNYKFEGSFRYLRFPSDLIAEDSIITIPTHCKRINTVNATLHGASKCVSFSTTYYLLSLPRVREVQQRPPPRIHNIYSCRRRRFSMLRNTKIERKWTVESTSSIDVKGYLMFPSSTDLTSPAVINRRSSDCADKTTAL